MKGWMEAKKQFPWMFAVTRIIGSNMETQGRKTEATTWSVQRGQEFSSPRFAKKSKPD